jgi:hypothetical protein
VFMAKIKISSPATLRDTEIVLMGRFGIRDSFDEENIVQADVDTITLRIFLEGEQVGVDEDLDPADVIYDMLQTGDIWTADDVGFNFFYELPHDYFTVAGTYLAQVDIVLITSGKHVHGVWQIPARALPQDGEV